MEADWLLLFNSHERKQRLVRKKRSITNWMVKHALFCLPMKIIIFRVHSGATTLALAKSFPCQVPLCSLCTWNNKVLSIELDVIIKLRRKITWRKNDHRKTMPLLNQRRIVLMQTFALADENCNLRMSSNWKK